MTDESKQDPQSEKKHGFWTPLRVGIVGFIVLGTFLAVYGSMTGRPVFWPGLIFMLIFYAAIYYLGAVAANKRAGGLADMMLAGRGLPVWMLTFTMTATWVGGGYINGTAEYTYSSGLVWAQAPWGYALSLIIGGIFFARPMRRLEFATMLDPLAQRYGDRITAILFLPALTGEIFWSAAILTALGTAFGTILGIDFTTSIIISAAVAVGYTFVAGLWSVAMTDVLQLSIIVIGLFLVLPFALAQVGGFDAAWGTYTEGMQEMGTNYASLFPPLNGWRDPSWGNSYWNWWDSALLLVFGGIPWQVYFQRILSANSPQSAMWFSILAGVLALIIAVPAALIGAIGFGVDWAAVGAPEPPEPALILPWVVRYLTPTVVGAVALGALAAAVMSSVDSSVLAASSLSSWNVYRPLVRPNASHDQLHKVVRRAVVVIGTAATIIALNVQSVYELWYLCSDFVYCMLFPQLTMALFFKGANRYGAVAGIIVSFILRFGGGEPVLGLPIILPYPMIEDGAVLFPFRTLAMVSGLVTIFVVSKLTARMDPPRPLENTNRI